MTKEEVLKLVNEYGRGGLPHTASLGEEIYGEIYLEPVKGMKAVRKTKDRFAQIGISSLVDTTILDVGCHIGSLSFYAHQLGARRVVGVDTNPDRVKTAKAIRDFNNIHFTEVAFLNDLDHVHGTFNIVFCCSVDDYVEDKKAFYQELVSRGRNYLILESNIQKYATHPVVEFCLDKRLNYKWLGEVVDKYPYGENRTRNLFIIEL